jgi:hypothetical protein
MDLGIEIMASPIICAVSFFSQQPARIWRQKCST